MASSAEVKNQPCEVAHIRLVHDKEAGSRELHLEDTRDRRWLLVAGCQ